MYKVGSTTGSAPDKQSEGCG